MLLQFLSADVAESIRLFDGIGTEIVGILISFVLGGAVGYKIGMKNKVKQNQRAGKNSNQTQTGSVNIYNGK